MRTLLTIFFVITFLQARTQTIGYVVVKDTAHVRYSLKTLEIDAVRQICPMVDLDSLRINNYFEYKDDRVYYYVERKIAIKKKNRFKLKKIK